MVNKQRDPADRQSRTTFRTTPSRTRTTTPQANPGWTTQKILMFGEGFFAEVLLFLALLLRYFASAVSGG